MWDTQFSTDDPGCAGVVSSEVGVPRTYHGETVVPILFLVQELYDLLGDEPFAGRSIGGRDQDEVLGDSEQLGLRGPKRDPH